MSTFKNFRDLKGVFQDLFVIKHDYNQDFGFPDYVKFKDFYKQYCRNGLAAAGVDKTINKTWEDNPTFRLDDAADELTPEEQKIHDHLTKIRFWQHVAEADRRSMVGDYAGLIFRFADNKKMHEPVDVVPGGLLGLVEVIPAWESQLKVTSFVTEPSDPDYGKPKEFHFNESEIKTDRKQPRSFQVHPDRVVVWSRSGTVHDVSPLSSGYNDLVTIQKVVGAGGEGFWKNSKGAPILEIDKDAQLDQLASAQGVAIDDLADSMEKQVEDFNRGFDSSLLLQGINVKTLPVALPQPEQFFSIAVQSFAASLCMPVKILLGMQTGERASTEDASEWAATIMARRNNQVIPNLMGIAEKLRNARVFSDADWSIKWSDLTESSMSDKIDRADKMATVNGKNVSAGGTEFIFTEEEIREAVDLPPLEDIAVDKPDEDEGNNDE